MAAPAREASCEACAPPPLGPSAPRPLRPSAAFGESVVRVRCPCVVIFQSGAGCESGISPRRFRHGDAARGW